MKRSKHGRARPPALGSVPPRDAAQRLARQLYDDCDTKAEVIEALSMLIESWMISMALGDKLPDRVRDEARRMLESS